MHLLSALFATWSTINESTKFSFSELIYGRQIWYLLDYNPKKVTLIKDEDQIEDYYQIETRRLQIIRQKAQTFIEKAQIRQKKAHDKTIKNQGEKLSIGNKVLVFWNMIE